MRRFDIVEPLVMLATVLQWVALAGVTGLIVGGGASLFLRGLFLATDYTAAVPLHVQMAMLPAGGLLNGLLLYYGYRINTTGLKDTLFAAVDTQAGRMPLRTIAIKPLAAIITLASGGSAGKEGPCSHIGASLGAAVGRVLRLNAELRVRIVACGVSAGFAAVFGTPLAGAIYGVEVLAIGRIRTDFLFPAVIASVISFEVSEFLGVPYQYYFFTALPAFSGFLFIKTIALGIAGGIAAMTYVESVHRFGRLAVRAQTRFSIWPPLVPALGGVVLAALILVIPTDYLGLSLPLMDRALSGEPMPYLGFVWKALLVGITIGSGFYGGVVTPQFVIGALIGNAFAPLLGVDPALGAAAGLVGVTAAASNTPVAAVLMGVELFGGVAGTLYLPGAAIAAYVMIGHRSIYSEQRLAYAKSSWMKLRPGLPVETGRVWLAPELRRLGRRRR